MSLLTPAMGHNGLVLKKGLAIVVAAFVLYYLLTAPAGAANVVTDATTAVLDAFGQVGIFVNHLFS